MAFGFFDGVFVGAPIALLAATSRPVPVYCGAVIAVILLVIACCRWVDRRWDEWFSGKGRRIETRLEGMRASRLMRHPVAWIQRGSDRWYALAAAVANPILVAGFARFDERGVDRGAHRGSITRWAQGSGRSPRAPRYNPGMTVSVSRAP